MRSTDKELLARAMEKKIERLRIILQQDESELASILSTTDRDAAAHLSQLSNIEVDQTLNRIARMELRSLQFNLEWLQEEDAGICEDCDCEIPIKRLLAVPTTRKCVNCAVEMA